MRGWTRIAAIGLACIASPALADSPASAPDLETLRQEWHRCVRQAFSGQPSSIAKQAAERVALGQCKPAEDSYVAAELAARQAEDEARRKDGHSLTVRARAFMASVAAYVVDPVTSWIGGISR